MSVGKTRQCLSVCCALLIGLETAELAFPMPAGNTHQCHMTVHWTVCECTASWCLAPKDVLFTDVTFKVTS